MTKVVRIPLISEDETLDYIRVYKELWQLQRDVRDIKNKTIQLLWEWGNFGNTYSKETGITAKCDDVLPLNSIAGNINRLLAKLYPNMYSSNLSTAIRTAEKDFKNSKLEVLKGTRSIIEYKANIPIELHNKSITIEYDEIHNKYYCILNLFSLKYKQILGIKTTALRFLMQLKDKSQTDIINRCIGQGREGKSRTYKISASKLIYSPKKKQWFLNLSYSFDNNAEVQTDDEKIMGVDLGIVCVAYMSFNFCEYRYHIDGGEITAFRHKTERLKRELQKQGKYCGDGRIGHGIKTRIQPLERLNDIIKNFRDTANHKYSRYIVDMAVKHHCGIIQIEDLKLISSDDKFLREWTYFDIRTKIEYKAQEKGIKVCAINPRYTSQRCSNCGYISKENRPKDEKGQAYFKCVKCGFEANADYNASKNIATPNIEKLIEDACANQKLT